MIRVALLLVTLVCAVSRPTSAHADAPRGLSPAAHDALVRPQHRERYDDLEVRGGEELAPAVAVGAWTIASGLSLFSFGLVEARRHRQGVVWLRAHNARVAPGSTFVLSLDF